MLGRYVVWQVCQGRNLFYSSLMLRLSFFLAVLSTSTCSASRAATLVVDNQNPRASDTNAGTRESPFKTINAAAQKLAPGDEVLVRPGLYREAVTLRVSGTQDKPVTLRSEVPHAAIIDGADAIPAADLKAEANRAFSFSAPSIESNPYWDDRSFGEWLYINGEPLERVMTRDKLAPMSFWEDYPNKRVVFQAGEDFELRGANIEFATREGLISPPERPINSVEPLDDVRIIGFTVQHCADWFGGRRAIHGRGRRWLVENNIVRWSSWAGIAFQSSNHCVVRNNLVEWCGDTGITASANANLLVEGNRVLHMNWRRINPGFDGGFGKFALSIDCRLQNNESAYINGFGPWFDILNIGCVMQGNVSHDSMNGYGLFTEISNDTTFLDNTIYNIRGEGLVMGESSGCVARRNVVWNAGAGLMIRGGFSRENDWGKSGPSPGGTGNYSPGEKGFADAIDAIPDLSPQRREDYLAKHLLYWVAPRHFMSNNNVWWENLSFNNAANYLEEHDYSKTSELDRFSNNFSDYNIFFPSGLISSPRGTDMGLEAWRRVSKRDEHSQVLDPFSEGVKLPAWAETRRALWSPASAKMRTGHQVEALNLGFVESPSAAQCRARFFRSPNATRVPLSDPNVQAWILDVEGQRTLALWTTQLGLRRSLRLRVGASRVAYENAYTTQSQRTLPSQAIELTATHLPTYVRGIGANVIEAPIAGIQAQSFNAPGAVVPATATFTNETRAPQKLTTTFASQGFTITPASLSRTLAPGATITVPIALKPLSKATRGNAEVRMEARLGGQTIRRASAFLVGEGGGVIPLSPVALTLDGRVEDWKALGSAALLGSISDASQISQGEKPAWKGPSDASAKISAAWTKDALWVLAEVEDDVLIPAPANSAPWESDAIELFVDGRDATFQYIKEHTPGVYQIGVSPGAQGQGAKVQVLAKSNLEGLQAATSRTAKGYAVEIRIPLSAQNFPGGVAPGRPIRLSLQLDDRDDANAPRQNVLGWSASAEGRNYADTSGWKTLVLGR